MNEVLSKRHQHQTLKLTDQYLFDRLLGTKMFKPILENFKGDRLTLSACLTKGVSLDKVFKFQLAVNVVALFIVFLGSVVMNDPSFTSVLAIMDACGALALATELPQNSLLKDKPHPINESILNAVMYRNIVGQSIYQIGVLITLLFFGKDLFGLDYDDNFKGFYHSTPGDTTCAAFNRPACEFNPDFSQPNYGKLAHYTIIFQAFVCMQIFNEINARKLGLRKFNV